MSGIIATDNAGARAATARPKIAHLTSVHRPNDVRIFVKECRTLAAAGYQVTLIAPHDCDEQLDGVEIRSVPKPGGSRRQRMLRTTRDVYRAALESRADLYHFHDPELIPAGILLKMRGRRVIYDVHENVPHDIRSKQYIPAPLRNLIASAVSAVEKTGAALFDGVVAANPDILRRFSEKKGVAVQNYPLESELTAAFPGAKPAVPAEIVFAGVMNEIRGLRQVAQAMSLLPEGVEARLILAGRFESADLETEIRAAPAASCIEITGWQTREQIAARLQRATAGIVTFLPHPNHIEASPNKLFEYMAAGIPVIASDFPLWRQIVGGANCGILVDPLAPQAVADAIAHLITHPEDAAALGRNGRLAVESQYNWSSQADRLLRFYERTLKR